MPARHRIKQYIENGYYHIYNRGVEKRLIFLDNQDYAVFLSYLKEYLLPKDEQELLKKLSNSNTSYKEKGKILKMLRLNNFADEITLLAYCLMPNHYHLFIRQKSPQSIDKFMRSLGTRYTMYFNRKYKRVGNLCQDIYKAVNIDTDEQFVYLSVYIHSQAFNQTQIIRGEPIQNQPSSYPEYLGQRKSDWVHPEEVLSLFSKTNSKLSYQSFIESSNDFLSTQTALVNIDD